MLSFFKNLFICSKTAVTGSDLSVSLHTDVRLAKQEGRLFDLEGKKSLIFFIQQSLTAQTLLLSEIALLSALLTAADKQVGPSCV